MPAVLNKNELPEGYTVRELRSDFRDIESFLPLDFPKNRLWDYLNNYGIELEGQVVSNVNGEIIINKPKEKVDEKK